MTFAWKFISPQGARRQLLLDSILKSRDITLPMKVWIVKAMVFPVVMYGCESWSIKKAECQRIDAFKLWHWRRFLRTPWTTRRSNQSILKEINPEYSLERPMLKLKLQYFGHLMQRTDSLEKTLMLGKIEGRRRGQQRVRWLDGITNSTDMIWTNSRREWRTRKPGLQRVARSQTWLNDWTVTTVLVFAISMFLWSTLKINWQGSSFKFLWDFAGKVLETLHISSTSNACTTWWLRIKSFWHFLGVGNPELTHQG